MRTDYYVYALLRADGVTPFYIGKGRGDRVYDHAKPAALAKSSVKNSIARKTISAVGRLPHEIICSGITEEQAFEVESGLILMLGRRDMGTGILANLTSGGEGVSGRIWDDDARCRAANAAMRPETRAAKSRSLKATYQDADRRAANNAAIKAAHATAETRRRVMENSVPARKRPEVEERRLASLRAHFEQPGAREERSRQMIEICKDPKIRAMRVAASNARWAKHRAQKLLETA